MFQGLQSAKTFSFFACSIKSLFRIVFPIFAPLASSICICRYGLPDYTGCYWDFGLSQSKEIVEGYCTFFTSAAVDEALKAV